MSMPRRHFFLYFTKYLFLSKSRQPIVLLAMGGLFLSALSLLVLQSTMGGLQANILHRSKEILGHQTIYLKEKQNPKELDSLLGLLKEKNISFTLEREMELMVKSQRGIEPLFFHGVDEIRSTYFPLFIEKELLPSGVYLGNYLLQKLGTYTGGSVTFISPAHMDVLFGEVPREIGDEVGGSFVTQVPEVDEFHGWARASLLHNLARDIHYDKIRVYEEIPDLSLEDYSVISRISSWEKEHESLVYALTLEQNVMKLLFAFMALLVGVIIWIGQLLFLRKILPDMASLWILGSPLREVSRHSFFLLISLCFMACGGGLLAGSAILFVLDYYGPNIMPDIFVEQGLPVLYSLSSYVISFSIPFFFSLFFSWIVFRHNDFKRENFLSYMKMY